MAKKRSKKTAELAGLSDPRAPLYSAALLAASTPLLARLEEDLLARVKASAAVTAALTARYEAEKQASRTAESLAGWTAALATQVAAAWLLSCVFVRTLEDRGLLKQARIAGPGAEDSQREFFQLAPSLTERDYLLMVFRELAHHPAAKDLFDAQHSLVWKLSPSAEAAKELLALFRTPSANEPAFRFGQSSTRFLGDLYQDISEDVRKRYALLQTPDFVEEFILDRTLEPAITRFGLDDTTLIDPTCGSGHFLLGAFDRLFEHRLRAEPGTDTRVAAVKALDCVYGADINPYAVAIARFRLTLSFLDKAGYSNLADAPALPMHLVVADSLRINPQHPQQELWQQQGVSAERWLGEVFALDDDRAARDVLFRQYAAVVGNPPYITVKDAALREVYRAMYPSCHRSYSLSVPFCERIFQLARARGYTGQITANSFMKREFGKVLIEEYLPTVNLERIVNTSGAYIPGHGTPTVLLFGTSEPPQSSEVHAVLAKRGEPSTPADPSQGLVWRSVVERGDEIAFDNEYISVSAVARETLRKHPWSLGGGGTSELKELLEERGESVLGDLVAAIGFSVITGEDNCLVAPRHTLARDRVSPEHIMRIVVGEEVRDWAISEGDSVVWPNRSTGERLTPGAIPSVLRRLWPYRSVLRARKAFGTPVEEKGIPWWSLREVYAARMQTPMTITFPFVATHNHFAVDRGGKVFGRTSPIIKLGEGANEDSYLALLAYLNSSTACFWMKQVFSPKGMHNGSASNATPFLVRYEFDGTKLAQLPIPSAFVGESRARYIALGKAADALARERAEVSLTLFLESAQNTAELEAAFADCVRSREAILRRQVSIQETLDWLVYADFGLAGVSLVQEELGLETSLGARAFEQIVSDDTAEWFRWNETNRNDPPARNALLVGNRVAAIAEHPSDLGVIERGEYKRRWIQPSGKAAQSLETDSKVLEDDVWSWVCERVESHLSRATEIVSRRLIQDRLTADVPLCVAFEWTVQHGRTTGEIADLVEHGAVPFLAAARYSSSGLEVHAAWERVWEQQRAEDQGRSVEIWPPRKFGQEDFIAGLYEHRGPLDVARERYVSYPFCESDTDGEPMYGWAGWDHLQRAQALGGLYLNRRDVEGWTADRLAPMLAGLLELIPWIKQWHNEPSAEFGGLQMGDYYAQFLDEECRRNNLTHDDLRAWRPAKKARSGKKPAKATASDVDGATSKPKRKKKAAAGGGENN